MTPLINKMAAVAALVAADVGESKHRNNYDFKKFHRANKQQKDKRKREKKNKKHGRQGRYM